MNDTQRGHLYDIHEWACLLEGKLYPDTDLVSKDGRVRLARLILNAVEAIKEAET